MRSIAAFEPPAPVRNMSPSRPAFSIADDDALGHVVVVRVDAVDLLLRLQDVLHHAEALVGMKSAGWLRDDLDAALAAAP